MSTSPLAGQLLVATAFVVVALSAVIGMARATPRRPRGDRLRSAAAATWGTVLLLGSLFGYGASLYVAAGLSLRRADGTADPGWGGDLALVSAVVASLLLGCGLFFWLSERLHVHRAVRASGGARRRWRCHPMVAVLPGSAVTAVCVLGLHREEGRRALASPAGLAEQALVITVGVVATSLGAGMQTHRWRLEARRVHSTNLEKDR